MDKEIQDTIQKTLENTLPEVVEQKVGEKVDEKIQPVQEKLDKVENEQSEIKAGSFYVPKSETKDGSTDKGAYEKTGEFFKGLMKGDKERIEKAANEGTDADGGYLVPNEFREEVLYEVEQYGLGRRLCDIVSMQREVMDMSQITGTVSVGFVGENTAYSTTQPTFGNKQLQAEKLGAITEVTEELINDQATNKAIFERLRTLFSEEMARFEDEQVLVGSGSGKKFNGAMTNASKVYLGGGSSSGNTSFSNLSYDDLLSLIFSVDSKYKKRQPRFFMSQYIQELISQLKDSNGMPIPQVQSVLNPTPTLFGYNIEITDQMPLKADDAADTKFLLFGDLKNYAFGDREQMTAEIGRPDQGFEKDLKALKVRERVNGKPKFDAAFKALASSST